MASYSNDPFSNARNNFFCGKALEALIACMAEQGRFAVHSATKIEGHMTSAIQGYGDFKDADVRLLAHWAEQKGWLTTIHASTAKCGTPKRSYALTTEGRNHYDKTIKPELENFLSNRPDALSTNQVLPQNDQGQLPTNKERASFRQAIAPYAKGLERLEEDVESQHPPDIVATGLRRAKATPISTLATERNAYLRTNPGYGILAFMMEQGKKDYSKSDLIGMMPLNKGYAGSGSIVARTIHLRERIRVALEAGLIEPLNHNALEHAARYRPSSKGEKIYNDHIANGLQKIKEKNTIEADCRQSYEKPAIYR